MRRQLSHHEDPVWTVVRRSEIDTAELSQFSRGYWSRMLDYLKLLTPEEAVKLPFPAGVPNGVESSIYVAARRKRMRISIYVRPAALYICGTASERLLIFPSKTQCLVCGDAIHPNPGTAKQLVCAGTKRTKSECQKVLRYSREHGVPIEQAKREHVAQQQRRRTERLLRRRGGQ